MARTNSGTMVESVSSALKAVWWLPLLRGLSLIILGVLVMIEPLGTLVVLARVTAIFLLVDGVFAVLQGLLNRSQTGWRVWLVQGLVDLVFAALILLWPGLTIVVFFYLLIVWTIALGAVAIASSAMLARNKDLSWPWLLAFGLLSVLFGAMLLLRSGEGVAQTVQVVGLVLGIYAFIAGAVQIVSAFSIRAVARDIDEALKGNSPVLDAINVREEAYAQNKVERAAEREAAREEAKRERQAEKEQRAAEKTEEKAAEREAKKAAEQVEQQRSQDEAEELSRHKAQIAAQAHDLLSAPRPIHTHDDPSLTMYDEPLQASSHHEVAELHNEESRSSISDGDVAAGAAPASATPLETRATRRNASPPSAVEGDGSQPTNTPPDQQA